MAGTPVFPFTPPSIPGFNLPFFSPATSQATPSPFNTSQQNILTQLANSLVNVNPSVLGSGSADLFAAETTLQGQGLSLNSLITSFLAIENFLTPQNISNLNGVLGVLTPGNLTSLSSLLTNPSAFLGATFATGIASSGPITTSVLALTSKASPPAIISSISSIPSTVVGRAGPGIISSNISTSGLSLTTAATTTGVSLTSFSIPTSIGLSSTFQAFIDALVGQTVGPNDFFSTIQTLYNFALPNSGNIQNLSTLLASFNQAGLLSNSFNPSGVPYRFPAASGDTFPNIVTELLTLLTQPGAVITEVLLTPTGTISFPANAYTFLNSQPGGATGTQAQALLAPLVNVLFGTNPTSVAPSSPFNTLFGLILSPSTFIKTLFSSSAISNGVTPVTLIGDLLTNPGNFTGDFAKLFNNATILPSSSFTSNASVTPVTLITDLFTNPQQFPIDLLSIFKNPFPSFFTSFFPSTASFAGGTAVNQLVIDMLGPIAGGNPLNVPCDILSIINVPQYLGMASNPVSSTLSLCNIINGFFTNIFGILQSAFIGQGSQNASTTLLVDTVSYQTTSLPNGWNSTAPGPFTAINGSMQGDIGFAIMCAATAYNEISLVIGDLGSANASLGGFGNKVNAASLGSDAQKLIAAPAWLARGLMVAIAKIAELEAALMNIKNVLNVSGLPTGPGGSFPGVSNIQKTLLPQF
jgi:hypothetical protein